MGITSAMPDLAVQIRAAYVLISESEKIEYVQQKASNFNAHTEKVLFVFICWVVDTTHVLWHKEQHH